MDTDMPLDTDGDGMADAMGSDLDGDGYIDTLTQVDPMTSDVVITHQADDGSAFSVAYTASGDVLGLVFVETTGEQTTLVGQDAADFLNSTTVEVPEPIYSDQLITQVPIDQSQVITCDEVCETPGYTDYIDEAPADDGPVDEAPADETAVVTTPIVEMPADESPVETTPLEDPSADADAVIGDESDANFWFEQNTDFTCGPASATQIVEDFTGVDYGDESVLADYAAEKGWLVEGEGMQTEDYAQLLTDFGVPSTVEYDQDWDDLAGYLEEGRSVVMFVDAYDYWPGQDAVDEAENSAEDGANHVVRIVAIDTERGVAIVSDSGTPDGQQMEVPLEDLEEAWNDVTGTDANGQPIRDRQLIVSDTADPTMEPAAASGEASGDEAPIVDASSDGLFDRANGFVLLPVTLAATRIFSALRSRVRPGDDAGR